MQCCEKHWSMMRAAVDKFGLSSLVSKDGETLMADMVNELQGEPDPQNKRFDPLMSMYWHYTNDALRNGGLYLLMVKPDGGQYCPVCEFETHMKDFNAEQDFDGVVLQMRDWCVEQGLITTIS